MGYTYSIGKPITKTIKQGKPKMGAKKTTINGKETFVIQDECGIDIGYYYDAKKTTINGKETFVIQDECGIDIAYYYENQVK